MVGWRRRADPAAGSRARDQARWLVRDHGDGAEAALEEKLQRKNASSAMRQVYLLTRRELRILRREEERGPGALPSWRELMRRVRALFRGRRRQRRR